MDQLNLHYMRMGEAYPQYITQHWWLNLAQHLTQGGDIKEGYCILTGKRDCGNNCVHVTADRPVGKCLQKCLNEILLPGIPEHRLDSQHPAILEESPQLYFGVITAATSPDSWEEIFQNYEVRFLAHEAWNGLLRESVEKDRFVARDQRRARQQGQASTSRPVVSEVEKMSGLAKKMAGALSLLDYVPDRHVGLRQAGLCEREIRFPVKQVVVDRKGRIAAQLKFSCTRFVYPSLTAPHLRTTMKKVTEFLPKDHVSPRFSVKQYKKQVEGQINDPCLAQFWVKRQAAVPSGRDAEERDSSVMGD